MPQKPLKPCSYPGCNTLVRGRTYCDECAAKKAKERKTSSKRGYGSKWQKYRARFLRNNPLCVKCKEGGRTTAATDVDHIVPVQGPSDPLFWCKSNHQALCHSCHSTKTAKENGGFGNF